jgi:hypothetical protein
MSKTVFVKASYSFYDRETFHNHMMYSNGRIGLTKLSLDKLRTFPGNGYEANITLKVKIGKRWRLRKGFIDFCEKSGMVACIPFFSRPENNIEIPEE